MFVCACMHISMHTHTHIYVSKEDHGRLIPRFPQVPDCAGDAAGESLGRAGGRRGRGATVPPRMPRAGEARPTGCRPPLHSCHEQKQGGWNWRIGINHSGNSNRNSKVGGSGWELCGSEGLLFGIFVLGCWLGMGIEVRFGVWGSLYGIFRGLGSIYRVFVLVVV